jgi:hypothetical protein
MEQSDLLIPRQPDNNTQEPVCCHASLPMSHIKPEIQFKTSNCNTTGPQDPTYEGMNRHQLPQYHNLHGWDRVPGGLEGCWSQSLGQGGLRNRGWGQDCAWDETYTIWTAQWAALLCYHTNSTPRKNQ